MEVHRGLGKTGVVGILRKGNAPDKMIGLRADMDALDVLEENTFVHRSGKKGKMHACGHDGHMAMLLGAAKGLSANESFSGAVCFIFQPAEENEDGCKAMVEDGLLDRFPMESVYGMHNIPGLPLGSFAIRSGPMMAGFDIFDILVKGTGGHAAMPHQTSDSLLTASYLTGMLQSIISRNIDPVESAVVSVTTLHTGTAYNIIPDRVTIQGTARYFQPHIQDLIESRIKEIAAGAATAMGTTAEVKYERRYPVLVNTGRETGYAIEAAERISGHEMIMKDIPLILGSEDFAYLLTKRPGAYIHAGAGELRPNGMLHQSGYDFNDSLLPIGATYWMNLVELLLGNAK